MSYHFCPMHCSFSHAGSNLLITREAALYIISVVSVCLTITFESRDVGSSFLHIPYISAEYGSSLCMKVIGSMSRSQKQTSRKSIFPQCKNLIGNNAGCIKHTHKFARIIGFWDMADRLVWPPSLSCDRKWLRVTECSHSRVIGLRLEGYLVIRFVTQQISVSTVTFCRS